MTQSENTTMMQTVIYTEAFFFLCLIMSFIYLAYNTGFEPHELNRLNIKTAGIFTVVLVVSSLTLHIAEIGYARGKPAMMRGWLIVTIVLGAVFLAGQGTEYVRLMRDNVTLNGSVFGTSFFTLTGFHGLHVLVGLVILSIVLALAFLRDSKSAIGTVALYWHFVDVVWIFVFTVVYVLPQFTNI